LLSYKINEYKENKKSITFSELGKKLTNLKNDFEWIKESHSKVLQQSIIDMDKAYQSFFKQGKGFPKFKSKHDKQSCRFPIDAIGKIKGNVINIIKPLFFQKLLQYSSHGSSS
jgi:putative transposase